MTPTVNQQLASMKASLERSVIPALPAEARFAQEQAGMIAATLAWLIDVQEFELRYELQEAADYHQLLADLAEIDGVEIAGELLSTPLLSADSSLAEIRKQSRELKQAAIAAAIKLDGRADAKLLAVARRQSEREQAWFRMTGFTSSPAPGGIADVIGARA
ncbi:hypothetical protein [Zhongshania marina]|uniref:Uncharacterized protein n=1 Tax=Zhongshania marina TaxID=2304603 RepID=A0ABX9W9J4_9GAMM|nr:hypothetical protein D0911_02695 [Zhongshania marina]